MGRYGHFLEPHNNKKVAAIYEKKSIKKLTQGLITYQILHPASIGDDMEKVTVRAEKFKPGLRKRAGIFSLVKVAEKAYVIGMAYQPGLKS